MNTRLLEEIGARTFENMELPAHKEREAHMEVGQYIMGLFHGSTKAEDIPESFIVNFARARDKDISKLKGRKEAKDNIISFFSNPTSLHGHLGRILFSILQDRNPADKRFNIFHELLNQFNLHAQISANKSLLKALEPFYPNETAPENKQTDEEKRMSHAIVKLSGLLNLNDDSNKCSIVEGGIKIILKIRSAVVYDGILEKLKVTKDAGAYLLSSENIGILLSENFNDNLRLCHERETLLNKAIESLKKYSKSKIQYLEDGITLSCIDETSAKIISAFFGILDEQSRILIPYSQIFALGENELETLQYQISPESHPVQKNVVRLCTALKEIIPGSWSKQEGRDVAAEISQRVAAVIRYVDLPGLIINESGTSVRINADELPENIDGEVAFITRHAGLLLKRIEIAGKMIALFDKQSPYADERDGLLICIENKYYDHLARTLLTNDLIPLNEDEPHVYRVPYTNIFNADYNDLDTGLFKLRKVLETKKEVQPVVEMKKVQEYRPVLFTSANPVRSANPKTVTNKDSSKMKRKQKKQSYNRTATTLTENPISSQRRPVDTLPEMDEVSEALRRSTLRAVDIFAEDTQISKFIPLCLFKDKRAESMTGEIEHAFSALMNYRSEQGEITLQNILKKIGKLLKSEPDAYELSVEITDFMVLCSNIVKRCIPFEELLKHADEGVKLWKSISPRI